MNGHDEEPGRPRLEAGAELDRQVELAHRQFQVLLAATRGEPGSTTAEDALVALRLTLDGLEAAAAELRAGNAELAATRQALELERQHLLAWFDQAPEAYVVTDVAGVVLHANQQAGQLLGTRTAELPGTPLAMYVHPEDRGRLHAVLDGIGEGPVVGIDVRVQPPDGTPAPVTFAVRRGRAPDQAPELRWLLTDGGGAALARSELREELRAARAEVTDRDNVIEWQSTLLGAVAHDLRTPLGVITGTIETLVERGRDLHADRAHELLAAAHAQSAELRTVLRSLLELSRFQLQSKRTDRQTIRVRSLVTSTLEPVDTSGHDVVVEVPPAVVAHIDPDQVARVLVNLVSNAVEHTPEGTTIWITAKAAPDDATALLLTVADDGPGVDDSQKDRVFEPFVHLDEEGSSGLGLAIVRMFASFHGGRAWVDDREGGGAAFHVLLPHAFPAPDGTGPGD